MASSPRTWTEALIAIAIGALGLAMIISAYGFSELRMAVVAGPTVFPHLIGGALTVLAIAFGVELLRGRRAFPEAVTPVEVAESTSWRGILPVLASTLVFILTIRWAGLVLSGTLLYFGVAIGFGSTRWLRDTLVGAVIALATYVVFNGVLGLRIPGGPFEYIVSR